MSTLHRSCGKLFHIVDTHTTGVATGEPGGHAPNRRLSGFLMEKLASLGRKVTLFSLPEVFCVTVCLKYAKNALAAMLSRYSQLETPPPQSQPPSAPRFSRLRRSASVAPNVKSWLRLCRARGNCDSQSESHARVGRQGHRSLVIAIANEQQRCVYRSIRVLQVLQSTKYFRHRPREQSNIIHTHKPLIFLMSLHLDPRHQ